MRSAFFTIVGDILRECAALVVLPQFQKVRSLRIRYKAPGELVTDADEEVEHRLSHALRRLLPGSRVVGEESCSDDPRQLESLSSGLTWLIDPIDGTANFAAGHAPFAMMVGLIKDGETIASWILDPLNDGLAIAEKGSGAWLNGVRLNTSATDPSKQALVGILSNAFAPSWALSISREFEKAAVTGVPTQRCAGHEYPQVAAGERDFALYWRCLPWDHAPGILFLEEAGGGARHLDGSFYSAVRPRSGLLLSSNEAIDDHMRQLLLPLVPSLPLS
jgi:fructose-1,6-bisphosphatase/inositol monophosphatase family enzyme